MKNKGFTLIELLAVIVILAIIAIIAVPIILNVIDTAKKGAKESSTLGYIDAVEKQVMMSQVNGNPIEPGTYTVEQLTGLGVKIKGEKPNNDSVITMGEKGQVTNAWVTYPESEYKVYYDGSEAVADTNDYKDSKGNKHNDVGTPTVVGGPTKVAAQTGETHKGIVYLDPTNLSATCDAANSVSTTETKTGCMKWYIFDDSGDNYTMILDHNTTALVAYETSGTYKEYEQASIKTQVDSDTTGWTSGLNPRLITANEITAITENTAFDGGEYAYFYFGSNNTTNYSSQTEEQKARQRSFAWLFDYIRNCTSDGCNIADSSTVGYWTSSPAYRSNYAWYVTGFGNLFYYGVSVANQYGIRPVITVPKSIFN